MDEGVREACKSIYLERRREKLEGECSGEDEHTAAEEFLDGLKLKTKEKYTTGVFT